MECVFVLESDIFTFMKYTFIDIRNGLLEIAGIFFPYFERYPPKKQGKKCKHLAFWQVNDEKVFSYIKVLSHLGSV